MAREPGHRWLAGTPTAPGCACSTSPSSSPPPASRRPAHDTVRARPTPRQRRSELCVEVADDLLALADRRSRQAGDLDQHVAVQDLELGKEARGESLVADPGDRPGL